MKKFKFRLGQKVIFQGEETKIIAKTKYGSYIIQRKNGWGVRPENMADAKTILKGTPMDWSICGWNVHESELTEVLK